MRQPRIKVAAEEAEAVYHCMSRTVNGEWLFDEVAQEVLRRQLWQVAEYCGVLILTYIILSNHFHVLVRVPLKVPIPDAELLRRYAVLHPKPTRYKTAQLEVIRQQLATNGPEAMKWRQQQLARMNDISQYLKLVKERFTIWFNKTHDRFGTLWAERFRSVLTEPQGRAVATQAAYIDLNCVRAGLVRDPKDYRFCGYAEAVAGKAPAQDGLRSLFPGLSWTETQAGYRQLLFGKGAGPREHADRIAPEDLRKVIESGGRLPLATVLRCQLRYLTHGAVLGTQAFVAEQLALHRRRLKPCRPRAPHPLPPLTDWGDLATLRRPRQSGFG